MKLAALILGILAGLYGLSLAAFGDAIVAVAGVGGGPLLYILPLLSFIGGAIALKAPGIAGVFLLLSASGWFVLGAAFGYGLNAVTISPLLLGAVGGAFAFASARPGDEPLPASPAFTARLRLAVDGLYYLTAIFFFVYLLRYYMTGEGGPTVLAVTLVPVTFILFVLESLRKDELYPQFDWLTNHLIAVVYIGFALVASMYILSEFHAIRTVRAGIWNTTDYIMGAIMALLIMEYARKRYFILWVLNIILILYVVYGWLVPGMFGHSGMSWRRVISAMSLEITTGVYSRLPQLALTLIGSFILVLSVLRAFGAIDSILNAATRLASRSAHAVPQAAVLGSFGVATVSGSGAANAATTGTATIPAMIAAGMPPARAAAVETASSLGGQLMPPIMGIAAFLMADLMGRSYFDVVARGYAPALIYFFSVIFAVYLLSVRLRPDAVVELPVGRFGWGDRINLAAFAGVVISLIALMGVYNMAAMLAALRVFLVAAPVLFAFFLFRRWMTGTLNLRTVIDPVRRLIDTFASMTGDLTLLLATLSIMTGAFVITGIPTKVGSLMMAAADVNFLAMALVAFLFGALIGTGLPPAPTYILTALVIAPPMIRLGVDPWAVHFFAFFLAVWGELTPPTSVVAAVTAKIADTSFFQTLMYALQLCISLFVLMVGVFVRPELVSEPGVAQLAAAAFILTATIGITFAIQGRFTTVWPTDITLRLVLAGLAAAALLHPDEGVATMFAVATLMVLAFGLLMMRRVLAAQPA